MKQRDKACVSDYSSGSPSPPPWSDSIKRLIRTLEQANVLVIRSGRWLVLYLAKEELGLFTKRRHLRSKVELGR